jgi:hypothetical protein
MTLYVDAIHLYSGDSRFVVGIEETASIFVTFPTHGISQGIGFLDQVRQSWLLILFRLSSWIIDQFGGTD